MKYSDEQIREACAKARNFSDALHLLTGKNRSGSSWMHFKNRIIRLGIDTSHFDAPGSTRFNGNNKKHSDEVLVLRADGQREKSHILRRAMIEFGIEYRCYVCGLTNWNDKPVRLHCEHINGVNYDNRPNNLCFLCPNCHSQTETYGYKGKAL